MVADALVLSCKMVQVALALLGLPLNGYILVLIPFSKPTVYSCLLLCMAISHVFFDMFVAVLELASIILRFHLLPLTAEMQWPLLLHRLQVVVWVIVPVCNLWIICALTFERYLVIMRPFQNVYESRLNKRKSFLLILFVCLLLLACSIPFWTTLCSSTVPTPTNRLFVPDLSGTLLSDKSSWVAIQLVICAYLLPSTIILLCHSHLLWIILEHRNRIVSTIYVVQLNSARYGGQYVRHKQRDLLTILHLFCTLILVLPYCVTLSTQLVFHHFDLHLAVVSQLVLSLTPLVNGYIYSSKPIKKAFHRLLQRHLYQIQMITEIDQRENERSCHSKAQSLSSILQPSSP